MDHFGIPDGTWNAAVTEIRDVLIDCAQHERFISYTELVSGIKALDLQPRDPRLDALLVEIATAEFKAGRGLISVLVVHKTGDQRPGGGFFILAESLGLDARDRDRLWVEEFQRVSAAW